MALVVGFRSSSSLAAAYGIAVTGTMAVTTVLFHRVVRDRWGWPRWRAWPLTVVLLAVDLAFFGANLVKIEEGGWFPIAAALCVFALMTTWKRGRDAIAEVARGAGLPLEVFMAELDRKDVQRVRGTAVFMTGNLGRIPPVLLHHLKHNQVLHERVVLVSVLSEEVPYVREEERVTVRALGHGFFVVTARYGFIERPDVPALLASPALREIPGPRLDASLMSTTFYLGRQTLLPSGTAKLATWRKRLFVVMARNAHSASAFFGLPPNRVVEMGAQVQF
jgi:KUP system potassium uptake protein